MGFGVHRIRSPSDYEPVDCRAVSLTSAGRRTEGTVRPTYRSAFCIFSPKHIRTGGLAFFFIARDGEEAAAERRREEAAVAKQMGPAIDVKLQRRAGIFWFAVAVLRKTFEGFFMEKRHFWAPRYRSRGAVGPRIFLGCGHRDRSPSLVHRSSAAA